MRFGNKFVKDALWAATGFDVHFFLQNFWNQVKGYAGEIIFGSINHQDHFHTLNYKTRPKIGPKWCASVALLTLLQFTLLILLTLLTLLTYDIVDIVDVVNIAHTKYWYCCVNLKNESWWIPRLCAISKTLPN